MDERTPGGSVEFLGAAGDDGGDDELDARPDRARHRWAWPLGLVVLAAVVVLALVARHDGDAPDRAAPAPSPPTRPVATTASAGDPLADAAGRCASDDACRVAPTPTAVRDAILAAVRDAFGRAGAITVVTRVRDDGELYSRVVDAEVPAGSVSVVVSAVGDGGVVPVPKGVGRLAVANATVAGLQVRGLLTVPGNDRVVYTSRGLTRLVADRRLVSGAG